MYRIYTQDGKEICTGTDSIGKAKNDATIVAQAGARHGYTGRGYVLKLDNGYSMPVIYQISCRYLGNMPVFKERM